MGQWSCQRKPKPRPFPPKGGDWFKDLKEHLEIKSMKVKCCWPRAEPRRKHQGSQALEELDFLPGHRARS